MADRWSEIERAILDARTRALAQLPARAERHLTVDAVAIRVVGERYAIEAAVVYAVAALDRLTPLPHAPDHVAGLVVRAGAIVPVFHLRAVMELPLRALPERAHVLFVGGAAVEVALLVDEVEGVRRVDLERLAPPPASVTRAARELLRGVDDDGVPLLDGRALLASERLVVDVSTTDILRQRGT